MQQIDQFDQLTSPILFIDKLLYKQAIGKPIKEILESRIGVEGTPSEKSRIWRFNKDGKIDEELDFRANTYEARTGNKVLSRIVEKHFHTKYIHDDEGRLIQKIENLGGAKTKDEKQTLYEYRGNKLMRKTLVASVLEKTLQVKSYIETKTSYHYDSLGNHVHIESKSVVYYNDQLVNTYQFLTKLQYNKENRLSQTKMTTHIQPEEDLGGQSICTYQYDSQGRLVTKTTIRQPEGLLHYKVQIAYDDQNRMVEIEDYQGKEFGQEMTTTWRLTYNEKDLLEQLVRSKQGEIMLQHRYSYK